MAGYPGTGNYTDLTSTFVYKLLLTYQIMDQMAENDDVFKQHMEAVGSGSSGATNPHGLDYSDVGADPAGGSTPADGSISQLKLKTSSGEVSGVNTHLTLPGGQYGFYPQTKVANSAAKDWQFSQFAWGAAVNGHTTYTSIISIYNGTDATLGYAQQRYVTASGQDHWIFLLVNKDNKNIIASYQAPDHPCYGTDGTEIDIPHPFMNYDPEKHEIVLVNNDILKEIRKNITHKKSLLTIINEDCIIDDTKRPKYQSREIIEVDEIGDKPGDQIGIIKTPDWAKIAIKNDFFELKKRIVEDLPDYIKYKTLKLKG